MKTAIRECKYCGKEFHLNLYKNSLEWHIKNNRGIYCSKRCFGLDRRSKHYGIKTEFKKGENLWDKHPMFKNGMWSYRRMIKRSGIKAICSICNKSGKFGYSMHIHHIDRNRKNNNINNLTVVCAKCHFGQLHKRIFYGNQFIKIT